MRLWCKEGWKGVDSKTGDDCAEWPKLSCEEGGNGVDSKTGGGRGCVCTILVLTLPVSLLSALCTASIPVGLIPQS